MTSAVDAAGRGRRGFTIGRLVLTTTRQSGGAPFVDRAGTTTADGRSGDSLAIVAPWRLRRGPVQRFGPRRWRTESLSTALVIGWLS